jgi:hypothetical protein
LIFVTSKASSTASLNQLDIQFRENQRSVRTLDTAFKIVANKSLCIVSQGLKGPLQVDTGLFLIYFTKLMMINFHRRA